VTLPGHSLKFFLEGSETKKNFYKVLGVDPKAGPEKIKRAFRQAAKRYHPNVSPQPFPTLKGKLFMTGRV
jgi:preprotein translocase subunit Sec63